MNRSFDPADVQKALGNLLLFSDYQEKYTRVRTPFQFPDKTIIDLFYSEENRRLTDLGNTMHHLGLLDMEPPHIYLEALRADINMLYGVSYAQREFFISVPADASSIAWGIVKLAEALLFFVSAYTSGGI